MITSQYMKSVMGKVKGRKYSQYISLINLLNAFTFRQKLDILKQKLKPGKLS